MVETKWDESCVLDELFVKVDHAKKTLESRFICPSRKLSDSRSVLDQGTASRAVEVVPKEFDLGDRKLTLRQTNG